MQFLKEFWLRLQWLFRRSRFDSEMADEVQFHIETQAEELEREGVPRAEALAQARREFGSRMKAAEGSSAAWQMQALEDLLYDLRYAARALRRNPGFAITAIACLAIGIGANATIFNLTTGFLFSQPSCRDSGSLIAIWEGGNSALPMTDYQFLRDAHIFDGVGGLNVEREVNWREGDRTRRFYAGVATDDLFTTLGVPFYLGRGIAPGETETAVLSYRTWRNTFDGDPAIVGRKLVLDGHVYSISGVLPANHRSIFGFGISPDVYIPATRQDDYVQLYARMPKGMNIAAARARVQSLFARLDRIHPKEGWKRTNETRVTRVTGFDFVSQMMGGTSAIPAFFGMLMVVVFLILLIACANVASLLLARAQARSQELTIRLSLGAGRGRIFRHLLAESLLLAFLGSLAGLLIDAVCLNLANKMTLPLPIPVHLVVAPDVRLLWFLAGLAFISSLFCGFLPGFKVIRRDVNNTLKQAERQTDRNWNLRSVLIAGQLAVSVVLLATAFLFVHNLLKATSMDPGFDVRHTLWAYMRLVPDKYNDAGQKKQEALVHVALDELRALPGVESAAVTQRVPSTIIASPGR